MQLALQHRAIKALYGLAAYKPSCRRKFVKPVRERKGYATEADRWMRLKEFQWKREGRVTETGMVRLPDPRALTALEIKRAFRQLNIIEAIEIKLYLYAWTR